jgi:hypothetical protein
VLVLNTSKTQEEIIDSDDIEDGLYNDIELAIILDEVIKFS